MAERFNCNTVLSSAVTSPCAGDMFDAETSAQRYTYRIARRCEKCGEVVVVSDDAEGDLRHRDAVTDDDSGWVRKTRAGKWVACDSDHANAERCDGMLESNSPPVWNTGWPIGGRVDQDDAAIKLERLPLVLVEDCESGDLFLVLSGGGMDLSWEIAAAHMALGFYPPVCLELPEYAGHKLTKERRAVIDACIQSHEIARRWMVSGIRKLRDLKRKLGESKKDGAK